MKILISAITAVILLAGCQTTQKATQMQLVQMASSKNEVGLCEQASAYEHDLLIYNLAKNYNCHPAQQKCIAEGVSPNSNRYENCVKSNLGYLSFTSMSSFDDASFKKLFGTSIREADCSGIGGTISCEVEKQPY